MRGDWKRGGGILLEGGWGIYRFVFVCLFVCLFVRVEQLVVYFVSRSWYWNWDLWLWYWYWYCILGVCVGLSYAVVSRFWWDFVVWMVIIWMYGCVFVCVYACLSGWRDVLRF